MAKVVLVAKLCFHYVLSPVLILSWLVCRVWYYGIGLVFDGGSPCNLILMWTKVNDLPDGLLRMELSTIAHSVGRL